MASYDTIAFHPQRCDGCGDCMTACAQAKSDTDVPRQSRIRIMKGTGDGFELALCRQCGDAKCVMNCPAAALTKNPATGVVDWNPETCVDCLLCTVGCAYGGIVHEPAVGHVAKCDMCDGRPACVPACPHGALELVTVGRIYNQYGDREDLFVPGLAACQGCNSELLIRHTLRRVGPNTVLATPPGCIPGMGTVGYNGRTGTKVPVFHPLLTNTASMLAGVRAYYERIGRDVTMLALAGDGGTVDVGFQSLSGAAERGDKMLYVCVDNEGYMNTGMQASGSTTYGSWTSTTPVGETMSGKDRDSKDMPVIMMMHRCEYVATASLSHMEDYYRKLERALAACQRGMAYLHVFSPCTVGWRFPAAANMEVSRKAVETNFAPLWDYDPEAGLRFTVAVDAPLPVERYIELSGKYRHLDEPQIAHIQRRLEDRLELLRKFETLES